VLAELRFVVGATQVVVSLHAVAILVGVVAGTVLAVRRAPVPGAALTAVALVTVAALAGAQMLFRLVHGGEGRLWSGGLASTGGVAAGLVATVVAARVTRRPARELLDAIAPAGLLALGIGRLGCFLAGCCWGQPTGLPWGVVLPELGPPPRHPLQLYSAAGDLLLVAGLRSRAGVAGMVACRTCVGFGLLRALLELLRDPGATDMLPGIPLTLPQVAALLLAAGGALAARGLRVRDPSIMPQPAEDTRASRMRNR
jgi:phosphatidylglycerol:prolipoprotein diacylglycerol transferase